MMKLEQYVLAQFGETLSAYDSMTSSGVPVRPHDHLRRLRRAPTVLFLRVIHKGVLDLVKRRLQLVSKQLKPQTGHQHGLVGTA